MTYEDPALPEQDKSGSFPVSIPDADIFVGGSRVVDNLSIISDFRIRESTSPADFSKQIDNLKQELEGIVREEKKLRIERVKLSSKLEGLHKRNLEYKKNRLRKDSKIATLKSRCSAVRIEVKNGGPSEVERLKKRKGEIESDYRDIS